MISLWVWVLGFSIFLILDSITDNRQKHIFAFAGIGISIFAHLIYYITYPENIWTYPALGVILLIVSLSSQFSGTPRNSGMLYAVLFLIPLITLIKKYDAILNSENALILTISIFSVLILIIHSLIYEAKNDLKSKVNFINLPILTMLITGIIVLNLFNANPLFISLLWILAILYHVERKVWNTYYPIPLLIVTTYLIFLTLPNYPYIGSNSDSISVLFPSIAMALFAAFFLWMILFTNQISKIVFYTLLASKFILIYNAWMSGAGSEYIERMTFFHTMLSLALYALTVQLDSSVNQTLTYDSLKGLLINRTRVILLWFLLFALIWMQPLHLITGSLFLLLLNGCYILVGMGILTKLFLMSRKSSHQDYSIIRPSLGIWISSLFVILAYISNIITDSEYLNANF
jgi:hypothetical protein